MKITALSIVFQFFPLGNINLLQRAIESLKQIFFFFLFIYAKLKNFSPQIRKTMGFSTALNVRSQEKLAPVKTISMHGSTISSFDNRQIWKKYDYKQLGIIAEPCFDINFNQLYYLTDTGRRWDSHLYNVRDKATTDNPVTNPQFLKLQYHTTSDIIRAVNEGTFPNQAMLNFHPQRWNDAFVPWVKELVWQNIKNQGKRMLKAVRGER